MNILQSAKTLLLAVSLCCANVMADSSAEIDIPFMDEDFSYLSKMATDLRSNSESINTVTDAIANTKTELNSLNEEENYQISLLQKVNEEIIGEITGRTDQGKAIAKVTTALKEMGDAVLKILETEK